MVTLEDLVRGTAPGEKRIVSPAISEADETGSFFLIRPNYDYPVGKFSWKNQPDLSNFPRRATVNLPKRPLGDFLPYKLAFDGSALEVLDYYDKGPISFVSDRLLELLRDFDQEGVDDAPASMICYGEEIGFNAIMPARAFTAADISTTQIEVRTRIVSDTVLASFVYPNKYRLNPDIPSAIDMFSDLAEPKMYWSRRLVKACQKCGIRGISAQTSYATSVETVEM